jgi:hypothetical protein
MGQFAEVLHMPPAAVAELTVEEFDHLADYLARRDAALRREGNDGG